MIDSSIAGERVRAVWAEVLGSPPSPAADFFADGGTSIQLVAFLGHLEDAFDCELDLFDFAEKPTVATAVALILSAAGGGVAEPEGSPS